MPDGMEIKLIQLMAIIRPKHLCAAHCVSMTDLNILAFQP